MFLDNKPYSFDRVARLVIGAGSLWALVMLLGYLSDVLVPFAAALLLAYILNPLVGRIQGWVKSRPLAIGLTLLLFLLGLIALGMIVVPRVGQEIADMSRLVSDLLSNSRLAEEAAKRLPPDIWLALREYFGTPEVQNFFRTDSFISMAQTVLRKVVPGLMGLISGTYSLLMALVVPIIILLYLIFLLLDFQKVQVVWKEMIPPRYRENVISFVEEFDQAMSLYFRGQTTICAILCLVFAAGFGLIGLPMGILLGFFVGILNLVPYLQTLGVIPAVVLGAIHALETEQSFWVVMALIGLVFLVAQILQDIVLTPRIMGKAMGLSPAVILLSLSVWGKLLGMLGLLIALPMTCLGITYYRRLVLKQCAPGPVAAMEEQGKDM